MNPNVWIFDCEVFAHDWIVIARCLLTGEERVFHNKPFKLANWIELENPILGGYNAKHYDQWILRAICHNADNATLKDVNDFIIRDGRNPWDHPFLRMKRQPCECFDLMDDIVPRISLKEIEGNLGMDIEETGVSFDIDRPLTPEELEQTIAYCRHDVAATIRLFEERKSYFQSKLNVGEMKGFEPGKSLRLTNAGLTAEYLEAIKQDRRDDELVYEFPENLRIERYPEALEFFREIDPAYKRELKIEIAGVPHVVAWGGLHGARSCYREQATEQRCVVHADVTSYYPSLMITNRYLSRNVPEPLDYLAVMGYEAEAVREALHMRSGSREISFRYDLLGRMNAYKKPLEVVSGEISMSANADIQRTGRFCFRDDPAIDWQNDRIKPWFRLRMRDGGWAEWPLGVFYMPTAPKRMEDGQYFRDVEAYDLSMALTQDAVTTRYFVKRGTPYLSAVATIIAGAGIRRFMYDDVPDVLNVDREWELGTPKHKVVADLLKAVNYNNVYANPDGVFVARKYVPLGERPVDYAYRADELSVVLPGGVAELDTFAVPNVIVGVVSSPEVGDMSYTYVIDNPANPVSPYNRDGRRVVKIIKFDDIASGAVLQAAVYRAAYEAMQVYEVTSFETALMPHHEASDLLLLDHSAAQGRYVETAWSMPLQGDGSMRHEARPRPMPIRQQ